MLIALLIVGLLILAGIGLLVDRLRVSTRHLIRESQITRGYIGHELLERRVLPTLGFEEPREKSLLK